MTDQKLIFSPVSLLLCKCKICIKLRHVCQETIGNVWLEFQDILDKRCEKTRISDWRAKELLPVPNIPELSRFPSHAKCISDQTP